MSHMRESGILWLIMERSRAPLDKLVTDEGTLDERTLALYGDVAPRLNQVLHYANYRWGTNISRQELAAALRCDPRTIDLFANGDIKRYNLLTTAKLQWYFGCRLVDLLRRIPPTGLPGAGTAEGDPRLSRKGPPGEPPPENLVVATRIPELLAPYSEKDLAGGLPLHRKAIKKLATRQTTRIARVTLAALCTYLSEQAGRQVGVEDIFIDPMAPH